jgi:HTH-type transcriptional regulator/antitoxin HigA
MDMPKVSDKYLKLIRDFPLRPIRNDAELHRATKVVDQLAARGEADLSADESAYLDVLSDVVEKYEERRYPLHESTAAEMLAFLIEQRNVTQKDVAEATGIPISTISELISGKRAFTLNHVKRLIGYFHVSPAVFVAAKTLEPVA